MDCAVVSVLTQTPQLHCQTMLKWGHPTATPAIRLIQLLFNLTSHICINDTYTTWKRPLVICCYGISYFQKYFMIEDLIKRTLHFHFI